MSDLTVRGIKIENLEKQVAELEAENERLKCCGNCDRWNPWDTPTSCAVDSMYALGSRPCRFTPSRWTERITP